MLPDEIVKDIEKTSGGEVEEVKEEVIKVEETKVNELLDVSKEQVISGENKTLETDSLSCKIIQKTPKMKLF